jgi:hypothetical protein
VQDQIQYLENLLKGYKERYAKGEKDLADKISHTAARLAEIKTKKEYETEQISVKSLLEKLPMLRRMKRGCCGR